MGKRGAFFAGLFRASFDALGWPEGLPVRAMHICLNVLLGVSFSPQALRCAVHPLPGYLESPEWRTRDTAAAGSTSTPQIISGPLTVSDNPHYFKDATGTALILTGSQTWNTFQDWGSNGSLQTLDFDAFVKFLTAHGHNFTLLWHTEFTEVLWVPSTSSFPSALTVGPHPWLLAASPEFQFAFT